MNEKTLDFVEKRLESFAQTQQALLLDIRKATQLDNEKFKEEFTVDIQGIVENQIKITVNGKIDKIAQHLQDQDVMTGKLMVLLEDKKFIQQLWNVLKFLGGLAVSIGTAFLLYKKLLK